MIPTNYMRPSTFTFLDVSVDLKIVTFLPANEKEVLPDFPLLSLTVVFEARSSAFYHQRFFKRF